VVDPLYTADVIFMGPGSPTYAVRQLKNSLAWDILLASHRLGATIALSSAAAIAISAYALPVYEIYKVGEDLHWKPGLDLFGQYGSSLVFIPHYNNNEGGEELDTSRCFMGKSRFARLIDLLPPDQTLIGIDEKTGLLINPQTGECQVIGTGSVTLIHTGQTVKVKSPEEDLNNTGLTDISRHHRGHVHQFLRGQSFSLARIGALHTPVEGDGLPVEVWQKTLAARKALAVKPEPPPEVLALLADVKLPGSARLVSRGWDPQAHF
jgi:hypothetical protein